MKRTERDSLGTVEIEAERYWGAQTERARTHFAIGVEPMPPVLIAALVRTKRAAALVNAALGLLDDARANAIVNASDEILAGRFADEFPLAVWQTGSGTQSNMNVNEVIANRANELLGAPRGKSPVHPNDHVNLGQSSNDVFPTAMHVAITGEVAVRLLPALAVLRATLDAKAGAFATVVKIGRTHLQDATPITLGQEISGWVAQLDRAIAAIHATTPGLHELAIGGTAVGTGLNTHPEFGERVAAELARETGRPFACASNRFAMLAGHEALVFGHGALRVLATTLTKLANDVRWLASGPRAGIGEITIPENEPGSSIMPGKVNPTQCEALTMVCAQVMGNDVTVGIAGASGNFELNVYKPLLAHAMLQSIRLLADASRSFEEHCARGIEPRRDVIDQHLRASLMLVTALVPHLGYDAAAAIARTAYATGGTLRDAAIAAGVAGDDFDAWVRPDTMV